MIGCLIIARLSSSRLPQKNVLELNNIPMIVNLHDRIKKSKFIDRIIICTSDDVTDDPLEVISKKNNLLIYRGSLNNIMERICSAAFKFKLENIVEILGDNPLIDSELIDCVIQYYLENNLDYACNISKDYQKELLLKKYKCFPIGLRVQIYKEKIAKQYTNFLNKVFVSDHPTNFIFENKKKYKVGFFQANNEWEFLNKEKLSFAVNKEDQFEKIKFVYSNFRNNNFSVKEALEFIKKNNIDFEI